MSGPQNTPRPCPFCRATWEGSDLTVRHDGRDHLVVCRSCGARGPATEERGMALDLWNGVRRGGDLGADQSDLFELSIDPNDPNSYLVDGQSIPMTVQPESILVHR